MPLNTGTNVSTPTTQTEYTSRTSLNRQEDTIRTTFNDTLQLLTKNSPNPYKVKTALNFVHEVIRQKRTRSEFKTFGLKILATAIRHGDGQVSNPAARLLMQLYRDSTTVIQKGVVHTALGIASEWLADQKSGKEQNETRKLIYGLILAAKQTIRENNELWSNLQPLKLYDMAFSKLIDESEDDKNSDDDTSRTESNDIQNMPEKPQTNQMDHNSTSKGEKKPPQRAPSEETHPELKEHSDRILNTYIEGKGYLSDQEIDEAIENLKIIDIRMPDFLPDIGVLAKGTWPISELSEPLEQIPETSGFIQPTNTGEEDELEIEGDSRIEDSKYEEDKSDNTVEQL